MISQYYYPYGERSGLLRFMGWDELRVVADAERMAWLCVGGLLHRWVPNARTSDVVFRPECHHFELRLGDQMIGNIKIIPRDVIASEGVNLYTLVSDISDAMDGVCYRTRMAPRIVFVLPPWHNFVDEDSYLVVFLRCDIPIIDEFRLYQCIYRLGAICAPLERKIAYEYSLRWQVERIFNEYRHRVTNLPKARVSKDLCDVYKNMALAS